MFGGRLRKALDALGDYLERYGADAGSGFFSLVITVLSVWFAARQFDGIWFCGVVVAAIGCLVFFILSLWAKEKERRSAKTRTSEQIVDLARRYVQHLATERLQFGRTGDYCERITVYTFEDGHPVQFYRFSGNPVYMSSVERHEGCLEKATKNEPRFFVDSLRDPTTAPVRYAEQHESILGIAREMAASLVMKSRLYFGCRIANADHEAIAVVLVESTRNDRFTEDELRKVFEGERQFLVDLLKLISSKARDEVKKPS